MRSIEARFVEIQSRYPNLGVYPCLAMAVSKKHFSRKNLVKNFKKVMPFDDFSKDDQKELIDHLEYLTNSAEEGEKLTKFDRRAL